MPRLSDRRVAQRESSPSRVRPKHRSTSIAVPSTGNVVLHDIVSHVDALEEQLKRAPRPFPSLTINAAKKHIDDFEYDDFTVDGYKPYPKIQMEMAV